MKKLDQYSPSIPAESNFAYGLLKNETAPSAGDGTAILAQHLQDLYYALYGVLQLAGEDPNETLEATNNKQFLGALSKIGIQRYNALNSYSQGMLAWSISLGAISVYISKTNSNVGNALSSTTHWQLVYSINMSGVVTFNNIAYDPTISGLTATSVKGAIDEIANSVSNIPTGAVLSYSGTTAPTGFLISDGSAISRSEYSGLFTAIGTTFGVGDGTTTFNIPDMRGRVPVGVLGGDSNFGSLNSSGGAKTHTLTIAEMPSHNHTYNHTVNPNANNSNGFTAGRGQTNTGNTGGGQAHNNLQPYRVLNFIIKY